MPFAASRLQSASETWRFSLLAFSSVRVSSAREPVRMSRRVSLLSLPCVISDSKNVALIAGSVFERKPRMWRGLVLGVGNAEPESSKSSYLTAPRKSAGDAGILALICIKDGVPDGMIRMSFSEVVLCSPECSPQTRSARTRNLSLRSPSHSSSPSRQCQPLPSSRGKRRRTSPPHLTVMIT